MAVIGKVKINLNFSGLIIPHSATVVDKIEHNIILGADFLSSNQITIDYKAKSVDIADDLVHLPLQNSLNEKNCVTTISSTCILAYTEALVTVFCPLRFNGQNVILESLPSF